MTVVLDAGGITALAGQRARLRELRERGHWPAQVPAVVLAEALTGDHRRDFDENRLLRSCQVRDVDELVARRAAALRTATRRAGEVSAADAIVAAFAERLPDAVVVTSDMKDLTALTAHCRQPVLIMRV